MQTFHERLRAARIEQGFTQEELAKAIGVTKSTMAKYDRGELEPNISNIMKLSQVLCVSVDYLLFGEDPLENELRACVEMLEYKMIGKVDNAVDCIEIKSSALQNFFTEIFDAYETWSSQDDQYTDAIFEYDAKIDSIIEKTVDDIKKERVIKSKATVEKMRAELANRAKLIRAKLISEKEND